MLSLVYFFQGCSHSFSTWQRWVFVKRFGCGFGPLVHGLPKFIQQSAAAEQQRQNIVRHLESMHREGAIDSEILKRLTAYCVGLAHERRNVSEVEIELSNWLLLNADWQVEKELYNLHKKVALQRRQEVKKAQSRAHEEAVDAVLHDRHEVLTEWTPAMSPLSVIQWQLGWDATNFEKKYR